MRAFKVIPKKLSKQLEEQFPQLKSSDCDLDGFNYDARVCIFDHFLDGDEANELLDNVPMQERHNRDLKWSAFYEALCLNFDVYMVKYRSRKVVFKAPKSSQLLKLRLEKLESAGCVRISVCPASCFGIVRPSDLFFVTPHFLTYFSRFSQTFFPLRFAC